MQALLKAQQAFFSGMYDRPVSALTEHPNHFSEYGRGKLDRALDRNRFYIEGIGVTALT